MTPLEVGPLQGLAALALALLAVGLVGYQLGHREGVQAERERVLEQAQRERDTGRWW